MPGKQCGIIFFDYKLILKKDKSFTLVIFKKFTHGTWSFDEQYKALTLYDEATPQSPVTMTVDSVSRSLLILSLSQAAMNKLVPLNEPNNKGFTFFKGNGPYRFFLSADREAYSNDKNDPYSKQNNLWRIRPSKPETDAQLNARLANHVGFLKLLMQAVADGKSTYISLHSFHTPLVMDAGDIRLEHYEYTRSSWDNYFYDTLQAQKAYRLLEKAVIYNGVKQGETGDRFENSVIMLTQVLQNLQK